jgi:hypothetical protein
MLKDTSKTFLTCKDCKYYQEREIINHCNLKNWPIPFAEERIALGNRPCWCPLNKENE